VSLPRSDHLLRSGVSQLGVSLTSAMPVPCYVISLPDSDRRGTIANDLAKQGISFEFVDGLRIDREQMERAYDPRRFRRRYGRVSIPNEVAAVLAHQSAYKRIAERSSSAGLILEDDAIPLPSFATLVKAAVSELHDGDVALLFERGDVVEMQHGRVDLPEGHRLSFLHRREPLGAVATIVTRKAARRLMSFGNPVRSTPDDWALFSRRVVVRAVLPGIVQHDETRPSEIGADRFSPELDSPRLSERLRWHVRTSRCWQCRPCREIRELALLGRAAVLRGLPAGI
jgi:GR25 family glycosyltransferase involved in LPS biosynthesis